MWAGTTDADALGVIKDSAAGGHGQLRGYLATFTTGTITARAITVTAATNTKGYDGTTSAAARRR